MLGFKDHVVILNNLLCEYGKSIYKTKYKVAIVAQHTQKKKKPDLLTFQPPQSTEGVYRE
jgi:hypothetical protein